MINSLYLQKFGENRFENFSFGQTVELEKLPITPVANISMDFLKKHGHLPEWENFLYTVFSSVERLIRVDFASKYYFHTATPTVRNLNSIKLLMVHQDHIYMLNPLIDQIEVSKNTIISGLDQDKAYIMLLSDDRCLQLYYGEMYKMLSLLNTGHALFNVEAILTNEKIAYAKVQNEPFLKLKNNDYLSISVVLEIDITASRSQVIQKKPLIESPFSKLKYRSSHQSEKGDVLFSHRFKKDYMDVLIAEIKSLVKRLDIEVSMLINNVDGFEQGYYTLSDEGLVIKSGDINRNEPNKILKEYQTFTNITGCSFWLFFHLKRNQKTNFYDQSFMDMGFLAQFISLYVTDWNMGSRGMKNYRDDYLKEKLDLDEEDLIGYSLLIFPQTKCSHSTYINI